MAAESHPVYMSNADASDLFIDASAVDDGGVFSSIDFKDLDRIAQSALPGSSLNTTLTTLSPGMSVMSGSQGPHAAWESDPAPPNSVPPLGSGGYQGHPWGLGQNDRKASRLSHHSVAQTVPNPSTGLYRTSLAVVPFPGPQTPDPATFILGNVVQTPTDMTSSLLFEYPDTTLPNISTIQLGYTQASLGHGGLLLPEHDGTQQIDWMDLYAKTGLVLSGHEQALPDCTHLAPPSSHDMVPAAVNVGCFGETPGPVADSTGDTKHHPPSSQTIKHATPADWERLKSVMDLLYLKDNLTVPDLAEYMSSRHGFHATGNMYKKQFRKWRWTKYAARDANKQSRRARDRTRTSCRRDLTVRRNAITRSKTVDGMLEMVLGDFKSFVEEYRPSHRRNIRRSTYWDTRDAIRQTVKSGLEKLSLGDTVTGMKFLRRGLQNVTSALQTFNVQTFNGTFGMVIFFDLPRYMVKWEQWEVLEQYLVFLTRLPAAISGVNPVSRISSGLVGILRQCRVRTRHFLAQAFALIRETSSQKQAISYEVMQLYYENHLGAFTGDIDLATKQLVKKLDIEVRRAQSKRDYKAALDTCIDSIILQSKTRQHCEDSPERALLVARTVELARAVRDVLSHCCQRIGGTI